MGSGVGSSAGPMTDTETRCSAGLVSASGMDQSPGSLGSLPGDDDETRDSKDSGLKVVAAVVPEAVALPDACRLLAQAQPYK